MGNKPKAPAPLDANKIAEDARKENARAAAQNIAANRVNQTDQFGNELRYEQTGTDAQGNPTYSATQKLGQQGQQFLGGLSGLAGQYFKNAGDLIDNPMPAAPPIDYQGQQERLSGLAGQIDGSIAPRTEIDPTALGSQSRANQGVADQIYNLQETRVAPRFEKSRAALETRLANQGINIGSEAWDNAFENFTQAENDAYTQMALQGQAQAFNQGLARDQMGLSAQGQQFGQDLSSRQFGLGAQGQQFGQELSAANYGLAGQGQQFSQGLAGRNQRVGELGGLAGLGVSGMGRTIDPSYVAVPQVNVPGVNVAGLQQMQHEQQMQQYNQRMQERNAMMGGLAGLGGTLLTLPIGGIGGAAAGAGTAAAAGSVGGNALANIFPGIFR